MNAPVAASSPLPLCVDLDGTLTPVDTLHESLVGLGRQSPLSLALAPRWLARGKAGFKRAVFERCPTDIDALPLNEELVAWLRAERQAGRSLVLVTASKDSLKLSESKLAMNTIRAYASPDAHVIYGAAYDESLGDEMRVTVVATGLSHQNAVRAAPELQVIRTGTDNIPFGVPNVGTGLGQQPAYDPLTVPRVWGTNRTNAAAKIDALTAGGMDDFEIPAFLRRQAD